MNRSHINTMDTDGDKLTKSYLNELNNGSIFYTHFPYNKMSMIASDHTNTPILTYDLGLGEDDILTSAPPPEPLLAELTDQYPTSFGPNHYCRILDKKCYELTDHLGNVRTVVTDKKLSTLSASNEPTNFIPEIKSVNNFFPFGSIQPGRSYSSNSYRYGFNGMEKDDEVTGSSGNSYTTHFRQLDPRLGRWFSVDPVFKANQSPYNSMSNNPILRIDPRGDDDFFDANGRFLYSTDTGNNIMIKFTSGEVRILSEVAFETTMVKAYPKDIHVGTTASNNAIQNIADHYVNSDNTYRVEKGDALMWNTPGTDNIAVGLTDKNLVRPILADINNFSSTIEHEDVHSEKENDQSANDFTTVQGATDHINTFMAQFSSKTFAGTTEDFKILEFSIVEGLIDELNFMINKENGLGTVDSIENQTEEAKSYKESLNNIKQFYDIRTK